MDDAKLRRKRKEEARCLKRKRIQEAGGVRPRNKYAAGGHTPQPGAPSTPTPKLSRKEKHRFGRVMERTPCRNKPRFSTLSIALPGSVVSNCQTRELRTHLVGQIARAAAVYHVDEIVVFDDKLAKETSERSYYSAKHGRNQTKNADRGDHGEKGDGTKERERHDQQERRRSPSDPHTFMARILQYCECPQYLRRHFFPMHPDLQFAGLLSPIDAPHHVRAGEHSKYREGAVLEKKGTGPDGGSLVNCGIRGRPVEIDRVLTPGIRCTVKLDEKAYTSPRKIHGTVVAPSAPREENGTYWGYTTRLADSINAVFDKCPFESGYDLKIGTSERGTTTVDDKGFSLPKYQHALIVFGGVAGIEECVDADESIKLPGSESRDLFDHWVNTCPFQGSRTIRTEEAVLISLARLSPFLSGNSENHLFTAIATSCTRVSARASGVDFSDDEPSDESSSDGDT